ncbi:SdrD B-like domain-containing protein [Actinosynnema mirum]|uniref:Cna B domain protein n=1 Tax=Actinosynnema mirum (strain ATCC 29888 / DSM 43827 / JCM 3225 / NBRC 14064 / NCIMB 13271 / NRRL B-12336 / IMRU 3971 / 101) TaxID=446462 RepID=C6WD82_ACTMD|nr:SdrD B-like domain-containing protein [Actinosynnema mirum]ACU37701.1 Cna B domain protein [Actinosynnema mirum DSM 43827]
MRASRFSSSAACLGLLSALLVALPQQAASAPARDLELLYSAESYGDFLVVGNGNTRCPDPGDPVDPLAGVPVATCPDARAKSGVDPARTRGAYFTRWADVDGDTSTFDSSSAELTIPDGAFVDYARLTWSGNTGTVLQADSSATSGCDARQQGAGVVLPELPPEADIPVSSADVTPAFLRVQGVPAANVYAEDYTEDDLGSLAPEQAQLYSAGAEVTSVLAAAPTGVPLAIGVGNVWTPEGFGCFGGWSLTVAYSYDAPDPNAPYKTQVQLRSGHVRVSPGAGPHQVTAPGLRTSAQRTLLGVTAFGGDHDRAGDRVLVDSAAQPGLGTQGNYFSGGVDGATAPADANTMGADVHSFVSGDVLTAPPGGTQDLAFRFEPGGDDYVLTDLAVSTPVDTGVVSGRVFNDRNDNGVYEPSDGDTGIGNVRLTLEGDAPVLPSAIPERFTAPDGTYRFDGVGEGAYTLTEFQPADYADGIDTPHFNAVALGDDRFRIGFLSDLDASTDNLFAELAGGELSGTVRAGGAGVPNALVRLTGDNGLSLDVTTTSTGAYSFPRLPAGDYTLLNTHPGGYADVSASAGTAGGTVTGRNSVTGIALTPDQVGTDYDFLLARAASITGRVTDQAGNGIPDVRLDLTGPVDLTTTTAVDGGFSFSPLPPGSYTVTETQPAGYGQGGATAGDAGGVVGVDVISAITLVENQQAIGYVFAESAASVSGTVFADGNRNGLADPTELGLDGVRVDLVGPGGTLTTTTSAGGRYSFTALAAGTYEVVERRPVGYARGAVVVGSAGGAVAGDGVTGIVLGAATAATGYDFAELPGSLAGALYVDADGDGARQPGEGGVSGVQVTLLGVDAAGQGVTRTATTGADGGYAFPDLLAGAYTVLRGPWSGYADGEDRAGTAGGTPVAPDAISGIALPAGAQAVGYLFAALVSDVTGVVFLDDDGDGVLDPEETGRLSGVVVSLDDGLGRRVRTAVTGADGRYLFPAVQPGDYVLAEEQPAGHGSSTPDRVALTVGLGAVVDFGEELGALGGLAWQDADGDGVRDADEPGAPGVAVALEGAATSTGATGPDGRYDFRDLAPGSYRVRITPPAGTRVRVGSAFDPVTLTSGDVVVQVVGADITQRADLDAALVPVEQPVDPPVVPPVDPPVDPPVEPQPPVDPVDPPTSPGPAEPVAPVDQGALVDEAGPSGPAGNAPPPDQGWESGREPVQGLAGTGARGVLPLLALSASALLAGLVLALRARRRA